MTVCGRVSYSKTAALGGLDTVQSKYMLTVKEDVEVGATGAKIIC